MPARPSRPPFRQAAAGLALLCTSACSARDGIWTNIGQVPPATQVRFQADTASVSLAPVVVGLRKDRAIGNLSRNVGCWVYVRQLTGADFPASDALTAALSRALVTSHVRQAADGRGELRLRGTLQSAQADTCNNSFFNKGPFEQNAQIVMGWRIEDANGARLYDGSTTGAAHLVNKQAGLDRVAEAAIADAAGRLLEVATVQQALSRDRAPPATITAAAPAARPAWPTPAPLQPILIAAAPPRSAPAAASRSGVGFFISADGYFLTATSAAPALGAQALRQDPALGVALFKSARATDAPLSIRQQPLGAADALFAGTDALRLLPSADPEGRRPIAAPAAPAGSAVLDGQGNVAGLVVDAEDGPRFVPIGRAFRGLGLGLALADN